MSGTTGRADEEGWLFDLAHEVAGLEAAFRLIEAGNPFGWTAWYTHARALREFFDCPAPLASYPDLRLSDFGIERNDLGPTDPDLRGLWRDAGYLVAHLSKRRATARAQPTGAPQPNRQLHEHLVALARKFEQALSQKDRALGESYRSALDFQRVRYGLA